MKATYTIDEAQAYIRQILMERAQEDYIVVEIVPNQVWHTIIEQQIRNANCLDLNGNIRPDMKIAAIKALRMFTSDNAKPLGICAYSLCDAKYAIENWHEFLRWVKNNGRVPQTVNVNSNNQVVMK